MSKTREEHVQRTCGMIEISIGKMSAKGQCGGSTEQVSVKTWEGQTAQGLLHLSGQSLPTLGE